MENILLLSSILLWVLVLMNFLLILALVQRINRTAGEPIVTLEIGQTAPDFTAESLKGERVTLADYAGRVLALVFVSPTCGRCRQDIPKLEILEPKARQLGVELILVSDADIAQTQAYVQELNITLPVLSAPRQVNRFFDDYKAGGVPFCAVIDAQGKIQASGVLGNQHWNEFSDKWEKEVEPARKSLDATYLT